MKWWNWLKSDQKKHWSSQDAFLKSAPFETAKFTFEIYTRRASFSERSLLFSSNTCIQWTSSGRFISPDNLGMSGMSYDFMRACKGPWPWNRLVHSLLDGFGILILTAGVSRGERLLKGWRRPGEIAKSVRPQPQQERYKGQKVKGM